MKSIKIKQIQTIFVSITWSFFSSLLGYFLIYNNIEIDNKETKVQNFLMSLRPQEKEPEEIVVLTSDNPQRVKDQRLDIQLADKLLENGAAVVVFNYPEQAFKLGGSKKKSQSDNQSNKLDYGEDKLTELIKKYQEQIVLVAPIENQANSVVPILQNPGQYIEYIFEEEEYTPVIEPNRVKGFFEYDPTSNDHDNLNSPVRRPNLIKHLKLPDSPETEETEQFKSAPLLALEKFYIFLKEQEKYSKNEQEKIQKIDKVLSRLPSSLLISYWSSNSFKIENSIASASIDDFCKARTNKNLNKEYLPVSDCRVKSSDVDSIRNKIILISSASEDESMVMKSPVGKIPAVEVQANILANLLTNSWFHTVPNNLQLGVIVLIAVSATGIVVFNSSKSNAHTNWTLDKNNMNLPNNYANLFEV